MGLCDCEVCGVRLVITMTRAYSRYSGNNMKALEDVKKHSEGECGNMACYGLSVKSTGLQEVVNWVKRSCSGEQPPLECEGEHFLTLAFLRRPLLAHIPPLPFHFVVRLGNTKPQ